MVGANCETEHYDFHKLQFFILRGNNLLLMVHFFTWMYTWNDLQF